MSISCIVLHVHQCRSMLSFISKSTSSKHNVCTGITCIPDQEGQIDYSSLKVIDEPTGFYLQSDSDLTIVRRQAQAPSSCTMLYTVSVLLKHFLGYGCNAGWITTLMQDTRLSLQEFLSVSDVVDSWLTLHNRHHGIFNIHQLMLADGTSGSSSFESE